MEQARRRGEFKIDTKITVNEDAVVNDIAVTVGVDIQTKTVEVATTNTDIDAEVEDLSKIVAWGINKALHENIMEDSV